jgi:hypothetical protein
VEKIEIFLFKIQDDSRFMDITAGVGFLGLCDKKCSYKHVSGFERLRSYGRLKFRIEGKNYCDEWTKITNKHNT